MSKDFPKGFPTDITDYLEGKASDENQETLDTLVNKGLFERGVKNGQRVYWLSQQGIEFLATIKSGDHKGHKIFYHSRSEGYYPFKLSKGSIILRCENCKDFFPITEMNFD